MINKNLCFVAVAATLSLTAAKAEAKKVKEVKRPNIVLIYADDIGLGDISCYGTGKVPTKNVDKLAQEGVRLTNAHTTSATSTPSRFGMLTGCYPWRYDDTGIAKGDAGLIIKPERFTVADLAKEAGYVTGAVGKWHLGIGETSQQDWNGVITPALEDIGFDYSYIIAATGDRVPCVFIENGSVSNYDPTAPIYVSYKTPFPGEPLGRTNPELVTKVKASNATHNQAIVNGVPRIGYMKGGGTALWRDEDIADIITDRAIDFIQSNSDNPFFLYFGTNDIHVPRVPHERFVGKSGVGTRGDAILSFDECVGRVVAALEQLGIADNTIIMISSDNGPVISEGYICDSQEMLNGHKAAGGFRGGKYHLYEGGTRVPFIVKWPGKTPVGVVSDEAFSHVDFMASISSVLGVDLPKDRYFDSEDGLSTLLGEEGTSRRYIIGNSMANNVSILMGDWKLIPAFRAFNNKTKSLEDASKDELYNIATDKEEKNNIADENPEMVAKLKAILLDEFKSGVCKATANGFELN